MNPQRIDPLKRLDQQALDQAGEPDADKNGENAGNRFTDVLLFVVDCGPNMHQAIAQPNEPKPQSLFEYALKCISTVLQELAEGGGSVAQVGVILYNTAASTRELYAHIFEMHKPQGVDAAVVQKVEAAWRDAAGFVAQQQLAGAGASEALLSDVLDYVWRTLADMRLKSGGRRQVILVTDRDQPPASDGLVRTFRDALRRLRDFVDGGVSLHVIGLDPVGGAAFDPQAFWASLLAEAGAARAARAVARAELTIEAGVAAGDALPQLAERLRRRALPSRALWTATLRLGPKLELGVRAHALAVAHAVPAAAMVTARENARVASKSVLVATATKEPIPDAGQLQWYFDYGGERVIFERDELPALRQCLPANDDWDSGHAGLTLLGFIPLAAVPLDWQLSHALLLYPDDTTLLGSSTLFALLVDSLARLGRVALLVRINSRNPAPRLYVAAPQAENGDSGVAAGLHMFELPFSDDLRFDPPAVTAQVPEPVRQAVERVVDELSAGDAAFDARAYPNPALAQHFARVRSVVLNVQEPPPPDRTLPGKVSPVAVKALEALRLQQQKLLLTGSAAASGGAAEKKRKRA